MIKQNRFKIRTKLFNLGTVKLKPGTFREEIEILNILRENRMSLKYSNKIN